MPDPIRSVERTAWRGGKLVPGQRTIPEETAVAFTYNGTSYAVMMATPHDLEDFAVGFSLTEGVIKSPSEIERLDVVEQPIGIELRIWLTEPHATAFQERRRYLAGPTGCGLCGIETLNEAMRAPATISSITRVQPDTVLLAVNALNGLQEINEQTRAVHGAAFYQPGKGIVALREDVGRHNALDKLAGALSRTSCPLYGGIGIVTSRLSVEMVQKAAAVGLPVLVAVSAPTALAVRVAEAAGITLIAVARSDGFEIFTHASRIRQDRSAHVFA